MILDSFTLDGQAALVTGAGQGLGQGMAQALAEAGADIAGLDRY
jgi:2-deoxy-D-gluconate 3-dehydrogenase